jgi:butyryl-CoA dehydrogenase
MLAQGSSSGSRFRKFQGIQWKLADHSVESQAARLLTYRAAWSHDDQSPADFRKFAAMAKLFAAKTARFHSGEAVQIFGMLGASPDSPVERLYRDGKLTEIFEGTSELQKVVLKEELGV